MSVHQAKVKCYLLHVVLLQINAGIVKGLVEACGRACPGVSANSCRRQGQPADTQTGTWTAGAQQHQHQLSHNTTAAALQRRNGIIGSGPALITMRPASWL